MKIVDTANELIGILINTEMSCHLKREEKKKSNLGNHLIHNPKV